MHILLVSRVLKRVCICAWVGNLYVHVFISAPFVCIYAVYVFVSASHMYAVFYFVSEPDIYACMYL